MGVIEYLLTNLKEQLREKRASNPVETALAILACYFLTSILLSLSIFLRLRVFALDLVKQLNVSFYFGYYYIVPTISLFWFLVLFSSFFMLRSRLKRLSFFVISCLGVVGYSLLLSATVNGLLPEHAFLWIPAFLMVSLALTKHRPTSRLSGKKVVASVLLVGILMPNLTVFAAYSDFLTRGSSIDNETSKIIFVSNYVSRITAYGYFPRANDDYWKFLMSGAGKCGEMATATVIFLNNLDIQARKVSLSGEDHVFAEVRINGTWYVVDPGYNSSEILTREQRAYRRIAEFGAISYVIGYNGSSFEELTSYYVPTDTISIRVTYDGVPLNSAKIYLQHEFMGATTRLPDATSAFFTDQNGTVILHMGALNYTSNAVPVEPYYWIYVQDKNTGYNVTSNGMGETRLVNIDLAV